MGSEYINPHSPQQSIKLGAEYFITQIIRTKSKYPYPPVPLNQKMYSDPIIKMCFSATALFTSSSRCESLIHQIGVRVLYCFKHQDIIIPLSSSAVKSEYIIALTLFKTKKCTLTPKLRRVSLWPVSMLRQCQAAFNNKGGRVLFWKSKFNYP